MYLCIHPCMYFYIKRQIYIHLYRSYFLVIKQDHNHIVFCHLLVTLVIFCGTSSTSTWIHSYKFYFITVIIYSPTCLLLGILSLSLLSLPIPPSPLPLPPSLHYYRPERNNIAIKIVVHLFSHVCAFVSMENICRNRTLGWRLY